MKKVYESPVFVVEKYSFTDSIAACEQHYGTPDKRTPIYINVGDKNICVDPETGSTDSGHVAQVSSVVFNADTSECTWYWDGTKATWSQHFYGNSATGKKHAPAYKGAAFWS